MAQTEQEARTEEVCYFSKVLHCAIGAHHDRICRYDSSRKVIGFLPVEGRVYRGELMVVGRATNGWEVAACPPSAFAEKDFARTYAKGVLSGSRGDGNDCPMKAMFDRWQKHHKGIPPFLKATKEVLKLLCLVDDTNVDHWASQLVWSQLYKIAPSTGNPTGELAYRQRCEPYNCVDLFKMEIERYRPKRLLLLTGWKVRASDFIGKIAPDVRSVEKQSGVYVEAVGNLSLGDHKSKFVVACRPETRPIPRLAEQVSAAFQD
jgi:hypothetical protein